MAEQRNPKILSKRLEKQCGKKVDYHILRGMKNPKHACYVISVLQLFFHCDDFINYFATDQQANDTEILLKDIYNLLYSGQANSIEILDFLNNWKGWGSTVAGLPPGFQDVQEFFLYFFNTLSQNLQNFFTFQTKERNDQIITISCLRVPITSNDLRKCIINETNESTQPIDYPQNLFIQLDRAKGTQLMCNDYISINNTIVFCNKFYKFKGAIVFINNSHYRSIIKIEDEYFDFDDKDVSPLFFDEYSVFPSSYDRCLECEKVLHRNSVFFLYEITTQDDPSDIHLSPNMRKMMSGQECKSTILSFAKDENGENSKFVEVSNKDLVRNVVNLNQFPGTDLKGTIKINTEGIPQNVINPIADNRYIKMRNIFKYVSQVLRNLKDYDTGKLNAMLVKEKINFFEKEEMEFVNVQGFLLYDIIKNNFLEKDNVTYDDVKLALKTIIDSYEAKYSDILQKVKTEEPIFVNTLNEEEEDNNNEEEDFDPDERISSLVREAEQIISDTDVDWEDCSDDSESDYYSDYDDDDNDNKRAGQLFTNPSIIKSWDWSSDFTDKIENAPIQIPSND